MGTMPQLGPTMDASVCARRDIWDTYVGCTHVSVRYALMDYDASHALMRRVEFQLRGAMCAPGLQVSSRTPWQLHKF